MRDIINAIRYLQRTGCSWRHLPHDLPPYRVVFYYFSLWRRLGVWEQVHATLHAQLRQKIGRDAHPSAAIADSQSVKTTEKGG
jgi:putative transposase